VSNSTSNPPRPQPTTLNAASSQYQNLVAVFPLWVTSSTATTLDYGPHGLVGTPSNVAVHSDPVMGNVFYDNGTDSNFAVPYNTYLDFAYPNDTAQPFTISCWINTSIPSTSLSTANNPPNMYAWTFDANDGASYPGYGFGAAATLANNGPIVGEWDVDGHNAQATMFGQKVINDGNWHLLTATYSPNLSTPYPKSTGQVYVDGVLDTTSNAMALLESPTVAKNLLNPFSGYIGTDDDGKSSPWQGMLCDLRFYGGVLSASQIATMYAPATRWDLYTAGTSSVAGANQGAGGTLQAYVSPGAAPLPSGPAAPTEPGAPAPNLPAAQAGGTSAPGPVGFSPLPLPVLQAGSPPLSEEPGWPLNRMGAGGWQNEPGLVLPDPSPSPTGGSGADRRAMNTAPVAEARTDLIAWNEFGAPGEDVAAWPFGQLARG
jgi:hypothetical protein